MCMTLTVIAVRQDERKDHYTEPMHRCIQTSKKSQQRTIFEVQKNVLL